MANYSVVIYFKEDEVPTYLKNKKALNAEARKAMKDYLHDIMEKEAAQDVPA